MDRKSQAGLRFSGGMARKPRGKHAAQQRFGVDIRSGLPKRATATATAVAISAALLCPNLAFAADWVNVDGTQYSDKTTGASGAGWAWDGQDDLNLNGYTGGPIAAQGNLVVNVAGQNSVTNAAPLDTNVGAITVDQGNLTIQGAGELDATAGTNVISATGNGEAGGDVTISGATVKVTATNDGDAADCGGMRGEAIGVSASGGDVTVKDGANLTIKAGMPAESEGVHPWTVGINATNDVNGEYTHGAAALPNKGGNVFINGSTVSIDASNGTVSYGICSSTTGAPSIIAITNGSNVTARSDNSDYGAYGIAGFAQTGEASVIIKDSAVDVSASCDGEATDGADVAYGIRSSSASKFAGGSIVIDNSKVKAAGGGAAILADNEMDERDLDAIPPSTITITGGSKIIAPGGGMVRDYRELESYGDYWAWARVGQVVGVAGSDVLDTLDSDQVARVAVIDTGDAPAPAPAPAPASGEVDPAATQVAASVNPATAKTIAAPALAQTGDTNGLLGVTAAIVAAFTAFTGLFASRRRKQ